MAYANVAGEYLFHESNRAKTAIRALNKELDRRSIDLFGVDNLDFVYL